MHFFCVKGPKADLISAERHTLLHLLANVLGLRSLTLFFNIFHSFIVSLFSTACFLQEGKPRRPAGGGYGCFMAAKRAEIAKTLPEGHKMTDVGKAQEIPFAVDVDFLR